MKHKATNTKELDAILYQDVFKTKIYYPEIGSKVSSVSISTETKDMLKEWADKIGYTLGRIANQYIIDGLLRDKILYEEEVKKQLNLSKTLKERESEIENLKAQIKKLKSRIE